MRWWRDLKKKQGRISKIFIINRMSEPSHDIEYAATVPYNRNIYGEVSEDYPVYGGTITLGKLEPNITWRVHPIDGDEVAHYDAIGRLAKDIEVRNTTQKWCIKQGAAIYLRHNVAGANIAIIMPTNEKDVVINGCAAGGGKRHRSRKTRKNQKKTKRSKRMRS
jgi:hypothetical protein